MHTVNMYLGRALASLQLTRHATRGEKGENDREERGRDEGRCEHAVNLKVVDGEVGDISYTRKTYITRYTPAIRCILKPKMKPASKKKETKKPAQKEGK